MGDAVVNIDWYFDFISPFAYLQWHALDRLPKDAEVSPRPILFAALLNHWGQLGPAEIPGKRNFTYRHVLWLASRHGVPMRAPVAHPFNPLRALRLALACNASHEAVDAIFRFIWAESRDLDDDDDFTALGRALGIDEPLRAIAAPEVKQALKAASAEAVARGVFGVPTSAAGDQLFWGFDATDMLADYLRDPTLFDSEEMRRAGNLPVRASRR